MKKIVLICLALVSVSVYSQDDTTVKRTLSDIVSKKEIKDIDKPVNSVKDEVSQDTSKVISEKNTVDNNLKPCYYEIGYWAGSFDDAKITGSYGFSMTFMPWKIHESLYVGLHFAQLMNYGLVDSKAAQITSSFGAALGYAFTPKVTFAVPIAASIQYVHGTIWSLYWTPTIYFDVYKHIGIFAAPLFTKTFVDGSKIECGFRIGLHYHL